MWKGGRILNRGYVLLHMPDDPRSDSKGYYPEHRKVWEDAYGPLPPDMHIHHVNHVIDDNRLSNLTALTAAEHNLIHNASARGKKGAAKRWGKKL
jgi:hypothetical protein